MHHKKIKDIQKITNVQNIDRKMEQGSRKAASAVMVQAAGSAGGTLSIASIHF
jgi:hypothetical protein